MIVGSPEFEKIVRIVVRRTTKHYNKGMIKRNWDDLIQEGRIAAWKAIDTFDPKHELTLSTRLQNLIRYRVLDYVDKIRRVKTVPMDYEPICKASVSRVDVLDIFGKERDKAFVQSFYFEGRTIKEIANQIGLTPKQVNHLKRSILQNALCKCGHRDDRT